MVQAKIAGVVGDLVGDVLAITVNVGDTKFAVKATMTDEGLTEIGMVVSSFHEIVAQSCERYADNDEEKKVAAFVRGWMEENVESDPDNAAQIIE